MPKKRSASTSPSRRPGAAAVVFFCTVLTWSAAAICNTAPTAANDAAFAHVDPIVIDVLGNDADAEGHALSVSVVSTTCAGTVDVDGFDLITYEPSAPVFSSCQIRYRLQDEEGAVGFADVLVELLFDGIFADGFESGDATAWSSCTPIC